jgi:hypothetical protein
MAVQEKREVKTLVGVTVSVLDISISQTLAM